MNDFKLRTTVLFGKPPHDRFIRFRPAAECSYPAFLLKSGRESYLVDPQLQPILGNFLRSAVIRLAVDTKGEPFLVPVLLPDSRHRLHPWNVSRNRAVRVGESQWVKLIPNLARAEYEVFGAATELSPPSWPEEPIEELVFLAFDGRVLRDAGDPVLDQFLGNR